jgi:AhpD family alkylhydroperoxidase
MKTASSRFQIHDDLTAPEQSLPIIKGALSTAGQLPNLIGVLAGAPTVLRAYARARSEIRHGSLPAETLERIALAVARHYGSEPGLDLHHRTARQAGLGVDEIALAEEWDSRDPRQAQLLAYLKPLIVEQGKPPAYLHEQTREAGWSEEQLLEAIGAASVEQFTAVINLAGDVPLDGSIEASRTLRAA